VIDRKEERWQGVEDGRGIQRGVGLDGVCNIAAGGNNCMEGG
jgi:hypothetical protein